MNKMLKDIVTELFTRSRKATVSGITTTVPLLVAAAIGGGLDAAAVSAAVATGIAAFAATWKVTNTKD